MSRVKSKNLLIIVLSHFWWEIFQNVSLVNIVNYQLTANLSIYSCRKFLSILWRAALTFPLWIGLFSDIWNESHRIKSSWLYTSRTHHIWKILTHCDADNLVSDPIYSLTRFKKSEYSTQTKFYLISLCTLLRHHPCVHVPVWRWKRQTRNVGRLSKNVNIQRKFYVNHIDLAFYLLPAGVSSSTAM